MSENIVLRYVGMDDFSDVNAAAIKSLDKLEDENKKATASVKEHAKAQFDLGKAVVVANQGMELAGRVIGKVGEAFEQTVGNTLEYNKSIRDLAQNLAIGTEETSRIVQTADDFTVSQEAVTSALQMAVKKGMKPSIDTLAQMADEYNNIADPTEKAARLTEVFGRNWTALTPMLKEGGQAIRDAAAAQSDALIVTEDQAKATRELEKNIDSLNDSVEGFKLKMGNALTPAIVKSTDVLSKFVDIVSGAEPEIERLNREMQYSIALNGDNSDTTQQYRKQIEDLDRELKNISDQERERNRLLDTARSETLAANKAYMGSVEGMKAYAGAMREANASSEGYNLATAALIINTKELTKETLFRIASEGLSADAALKMAASMGLVDQKTAENITKQRALKKAYDEGYISLDQYIRKTNELGIAIGALPDLKVITVEVRTQTGGGAGQHGGEVDFNAPPSTPSHPATTSTTTPPASPTSHGGGHEADRAISNNFNTTINAPRGVDINDLANRVSQRIARQLRAANNSGAGRRQ